MPKLVTQTVSTLAEFTDKIESYTKDLKNPAWFRGTGSAHYTLTPSLYRHPTLKTSPELLKLEKELISRFKDRAIPHLQQNNYRRDLDYLFLMQHFGVPTRLLDWTENPFVALFFALNGAKKDAGGIYQEDSSVWILWPKLWNGVALSHLSYDGIALSTNDENLKGYTPEGITNLVHPVAILGAHNSPRIVAQRGVFTIFGVGLEPMEESYEKNVFTNSLNKLTIPKAAIAGLNEQLFKIGITDSVVFPDLDGLAREIKRYFGFII